MRARQTSYFRNRSPLYIRWSPTPSPLRAGKFQRQANSRIYLWPAAVRRFQQPAIGFQPLPSRSSDTIGCKFQRVKVAFPADAETVRHDFSRQRPFASRRRHKSCFMPFYGRRVRPFQKEGVPLRGEMSMQKQHAQKIVGLIGSHSLSAECRP